MSEPEIEGADEEAESQQSAGDDVDNGIIVAATQGRVRVCDNGGVFLPGGHIGRRGEGVRVVDAAVDGESVVETRHRKRQARLGERCQRPMAMSQVCCHYRNRSGCWGVSRRLQPGGQSRAARNPSPQDEVFVVCWMHVKTRMP